MQRAYCPRCRATVSPHVSRKFYTRNLILSHFFERHYCDIRVARHSRVRLVVKLGKTRGRESNLFFLIAITRFSRCPASSTSTVITRVLFNFPLFHFFSSLICEVISSRIYVAEDERDVLDSQRELAAESAGITTQAKSNVSGDDNPRVSMIDVINGRLFIKRNKRVRELGAKRS